MVVKTFRGLLADGGQDRIRLQTIKGKVGYRIVKFQLFPNNAFADQEGVTQIFKAEQTSVPTSAPRVDLTDSDLLAAGIYKAAASGSAVAFTDAVIFDQEIFNQDIFITYTDHSGTETCNYYLELEVIPLDDAGAEYTTLKDMRQS